MTRSEPFKIKEVKNLQVLEPYERWNILKRVGFNTINVGSGSVVFDLVASGMSSWSQDQKAGLMIGDEAYAGSRNYNRLLKVTEEVLGLDRLVPTHNGIGAEKLLVTTMLERGQTVLHNRGRSEGLVPFNGGLSIDVTADLAQRFEDPASFGANFDLDRIRTILIEKLAGVAYIHVELCPDAWNGQPVSLGNLKELKKIAGDSDVPVVIDISNVLENALWINKAQGSDNLMDTVRSIIGLADIVLMDAAQDARSDVGGFVTSSSDEIFEKLRNQVVVFEGLHTYGGMTGRAMEVFACGLEEMQRAEYTEWYDTQVDLLHRLLTERGVPAYRGTKGVGLDVATFLPHLKESEHPKFALVACLFILGGIRAKITGEASFYLEGEGRRLVQLEFPRHAYTRKHIEAIANTVATIYEHRADVHGLRLLNKDAEFADQLVFEPTDQRLLVLPSDEDNHSKIGFEPYKIAIFEPIKVLDKDQRRASIAKAGFNTFLLDSEDVYIDLLTDSGTTAMSSYQWEGMTNTTDTAFSSRHYQDLIEQYSDILGFKHIILTHQGRAAEHIMSQVMIKDGQVVPGNMYFTTTKLHQEIAGGIFADVIVDEAHDPTNTFPWKGNIDIDKLKAEIDKAGPGGVAYVSFEMSVNMAGGQPFSMPNVREVSSLCQKHGIPLMFDATRCIENARLIQMKDAQYTDTSIETILREMMSYGDGCTISCKKDFMVNMGGILACNNDQLAEEFRRLLRIWEGDLATGGLDPKDIEALRRGLLDSLNDHYIASRVEQTQQLGRRLTEAGIPIVQPSGSHAIFLDAKRFLPHLDQDEFPAQALAAAIYLETGVRAMERGNVSKGRNPETGENYRPKLELVRLTIPRRVYTDSHFDFVAEGIQRLWQQRDKISGLEFTYEPKVLRFFQSRFEPKTEWVF